jgi:GT2 family glycosyltransferase
MRRWTDRLVGGESIPALVREIELSKPLRRIPAADASGRTPHEVWVLVRLFTEPLGLVRIAMPATGISPLRLAVAVDRQFGEKIRSRVTEAGGQLSGGVPVHGITVPRTPRYLSTRGRVLKIAPPVTVVVCTRERSEQLRRALASLLTQEYPCFRILVVDNAPETDATAKVVAEAAGRGPVSYLVEPRPGLSFARNAAVAACPGEILAWTDDDVVADPYWLSELARGLVDHPEADVVGGVAVPAELETQAQLWFEDFGGHSKGRGFTPAVFGPHTAREQSPLYPLPPFGVGANMLFRPGVIERIGGFDPALGAGSPAMGSEDTLAFTQILRQGGTVVYQPTALVHHYHRRDYAGLYKQMLGYGTGLTAAYTSLLLAQPSVVFGLLRLVPTALRDVFGTDGPRTATIGEDFPAELLSANRRGMLRGPIAYLRGRSRLRRLAASTPASVPTAAPATGPVSRLAWSEPAVPRVNVERVRSGTRRDDP